MIFNRELIDIIHFIIGKGGTGKSQKLISTINEVFNNNINNHQEYLNNKIFVIVPEQFSFEFDKKLYETIEYPEDFSNNNPYAPNLYQNLGAYIYNHINVTKFSKLSKQIIQLYGKTSKDYINELSKIIAMYQAIKKLKDTKSLISLERQTNNIDFIDNALTEIAELKKSNISPEILLETSKKFPKQVREKSQDMALIYAEYQNILNEKNLQDSLSDILECSRLAQENDCFKDATFFIDEFDAFTNDEIQLFDVILSQCKDFYVSLRTYNPLKDKSTHFEPVNTTYKQLYQLAKKHNQDIEDIHCDTLYRYTSKDLQTISNNIFTNGFKDKISSSGSVSIVECSDYYQECNYVCSQIRNLIVQGYSYKDIFVTARHVDNYLGIIERSFETYDIPYFLSTDQSSIYTSIMIYFIDLLQIISNNSFNTDDILRYIKNPITNISFERISDLENYCYKWNVKGKMWLEDFLEDDNLTANNTRENIIKPILQLKELIKDKTCLEVCRTIFEFMEKQSIRENIQKLIDNNKNNGFESSADDMVRIWDMLMTILDTLCTFMGDMVIPIKDFKDIICTMISQSNFKSAPQKLDAVSFSASDNARYNSPKVLFVLGVNDGVFPSSVSNNGIFTNSDMKYFSDVGLNFSKSIQDKTADEKLVVYKTLSAPAEKLYLSYALKDTLGEMKYPSYVIDSIRNLFNNLDIQKAKDIPTDIICSTFKASYDYFVRNFWNYSENQVTIEEVLKTNDMYTSKVDYLKKISNNQELKIQDKNIAMKLFRQRIKIYATKFETYNKCHFKYFCSEGLKIKKPTKTDISKLEIGNIIHYCLENIIKNNPKDILVKLSKDDINTQIESLANKYKLDNLGGDYGKTERFQSNFKRVKKSILQTVLHLQDEFSQLEFTPVDFELSVDDNGECKPLSIKNDEGMEIFLCGKIDRVDILHTESSSYVRVVDYKSGTQDFESEKLPYGIDMQMFLYLFAITGKDGKYKDCTPAGVLYMPVSEVHISKDNKRETDNNKSNTINKHFKMKGVVLDDISVIQSMDKTLCGTYVPFNIKPRGKAQNMTLSEEQFNKIKHHAEKLLLSMADGLSNGDISSKVLLFDDDKRYSVCSFCDYWSICGNYPHRNCRLVSKAEAEELYKEIINSDGIGDDDGNLD